jgi:hypothetical protein
LQEPRGAQYQVVGGQGRHPEVFALMLPSGRTLEVQGVAPVDQHEHRLQQVVAIGAPPGDVQEQVQLGRSRHVVQLSCNSKPAAKD